MLCVSSSVKAILFLGHGQMSKEHTSVSLRRAKFLTQLALGVFGVIFLILEMTLGHIGENGLIKGSEFYMNEVNASDTNQKQEQFGRF